MDTDTPMPRDRARAPTAPHRHISSHAAHSNLNQGHAPYAKHPETAPRPLTSLCISTPPPLAPGRNPLCIHDDGLGAVAYRTYNAHVSRQSASLPELPAAHDLTSVLTQAGVDPMPPQQQQQQLCEADRQRMQGLRESMGATFHKATRRSGPAPSSGPSSGPSSRDRPSQGGRTNQPAPGLQVPGVCSLAGGAKPLAKKKGAGGVKGSGVEVPTASPAAGSARRSDKLKGSQPAPRDIEPMTGGRIASARSAGILPGIQAEMTRGLLRSVNGGADAASPDGTPSSLVRLQLHKRVDNKNSSSACTQPHNPLSQSKLSLIHI